MSTQTAHATDVGAFTDALDDFLRATRRARGRYNRAPLVPGLSLPQFHLLEPLSQAAGPLCVGALAEAAGVSAPSATRMLDGLQERGLVSRVRDEDDRRTVRIALTAEGERLVAAKREASLTVRTAVFDRLSPSERRSAARLLHSLSAAIEELHQ